MHGDGLEERSAATARGSRVRPLWTIGVGVAVLAAALMPAPAPANGAGSGSSAGAAAACPTPAKPPRYPDVQPIFEQHCAKCHDARQARNEAAQAVFEMTSYPFSTKRPGSLLDDLRAVLPKRGSLSADEKCRGLQWLTAGALDAGGEPPVWR